MFLPIPSKRWNKGTFDKDIFINIKNGRILFKKSARLRKCYYFVINNKLRIGLNANVYFLPNGSLLIELFCSLLQ
ncbi:hypothetical protein AK95_04435 [Paenibacillus sp. LC231]|uniref:Uncharacterized protein n=1 Tax=Paenibacillus glucanolyticus TaxID=59843 RepID=A0A163GG03_9BACL|nr:hypothetical protein AWU65_02910 [Paenibacillus glucanolyticus]OIB02160.1 hypothetical protein AK95_04435 [Paenibacillus sp. LC231]OMF64786.1 hypothetical protein BK142_31515 [Paenibacillus glucanolyticus]